MRILLLTNSYLPVLGGLQTVTHNLAFGLSQRGHTVKVIANRYPRSLPTLEWIDRVHVRRLLFITPNINFLKQNRPDLFLAAFYYFPYTLLQLAVSVKSFKPDVINIHYPLHQIPFLLWLKQHFQFRLAVSLHGSEIPSTLKKKGDFELHTILRQADVVTACSQWLLNRAIEHEPLIKTKGVVIHNGVIRARFDNKKSYPSPRPYMLAYGRFTYQKGFDMLLAAFSEVVEASPDYDLILAGDGEEWNALNAQAIHLGLDRRVHFFGRATPDQVVQLLNGCHFVVIPSRSEAFGIVALEALAAGKPVLATKVGGLVEFIGESSSHFVEPTIPALARAMKEWLNLKTLPQPNPNDVFSRFDWEQAIGKYEKILSGIK